MSNRQAPARYGYAHQDPYPHPHTSTRHPSDHAHYHPADSDERRLHPPPSLPTSSTSRTFAFQPPPNPAQQGRPTTYAPSVFAAPSSTRTSPEKYPHTVYAQSYPAPSRHRHEEGHDDDGSSGDDGQPQSKQKLEVKREKNRLKQRNLRLRRANHVSTLETSLATLEEKHRQLQAQYDEVRRREAGLEQYAARLEEMLRRSGMSSALDHARGRSPRGRQREDDESMDRTFKRRKSSHSDHSQSTGRVGAVFHLDHLETRPSTGDSQAHSTADPSAPRKSSSTFSPSVLDPHIHLSASSPRSIRIEDLLSPSFIGDEPSVPLSAYTIDTPSHLASTPAYNPDTSVPRRAPLSLPMSKQGSADSARSGTVIDGALDVIAAHDSMTPRELVGPPLHPSVHTARNLLRSLLADQVDIPISHCILPPLTPSQQLIMLTAIYNLTTPWFRDQVNHAQFRVVSAEMSKDLLEYTHSGNADLRVILMPIAILRGRIVGFLKDGLNFDITAFISHVLSDARVFGDTADPDAWEVSSTFWDVWGGWFKAGRAFCGSMSDWRRRFGNEGSNVIEILLGLERESGRMTQLMGRPDGWKKPNLLPPDRIMLEDVRIID